MNVSINGEIHQFTDSTSVGDVIAKLGLTGKRIAVELNEENPSIRPIFNPAIKIR